MNLTIVEVAGLTNSQGLPVLGHTLPPTTDPVTGAINITLQLNSTSDATKEDIAATIFHETLHAYLFSTGLFGRVTHDNTIANNYVISIANALQKDFPNLTPFQCTALSWVV